MVRDTSREAYQSIVSELSPRQAIVLGLLDGAEPMTNAEIARELGWPINTVTPRTNELVKAGKLVDVGKRPCRVTGRSAYQWGAVKSTLSEGAN